MFKLKLQCFTCGKELLKYPSQICKHNYCSNTCQHKALTGVRNSQRTEFKKGLVPWNKGKKGVQKSTRKGIPLSPEIRTKVSKTLKQLYTEGKFITWNKGKPTPESVKKKISRSRKGQVLSPASKIKQSESLCKAWAEGKIKGHNQSEGTRQKISQNSYPKKLENRVNWSEMHKGHRVSEETKRKQAIAHTGSKSSNWKGGISFLPYCPKFNEQFKKKIREKHDNKCFICGKSQEQQISEFKQAQKKAFRLAVHHVNYQKNCLCSTQKCQFVPLCNSCHSKTCHNRDYWEDIINNKLKEHICQKK